MLADEKRRAPLQEPPGMSGDSNSEIIISRNGSKIVPCAVQQGQDNAGEIIMAESTDGFAFENEYSFVNRIQSENCSIDVKNNTAAAKLKLVLTVASPLPVEPGSGAIPDTSVLEFTGGTEDDPGSRALKVVADAAGLLFTDAEGNLARLVPPEVPSVLVFNEGRPQWFPVPDPAQDWLLGLDEEGNWTWYSQLSGAEANA